MRITFDYENTWPKNIEQQQKNPKIIGPDMKTLKSAPSTTSCKPLNIQNRKVPHHHGTSWTRGCLRTKPVVCSENIQALPRIKFTGLPILRPRPFPFSGTLIRHKIQCQIINLMNDIGFLCLIRKVLWFFFLDNREKCIVDNPSHSGKNPPIILWETISPNLKAPEFIVREM